MTILCCNVGTFKVKAGMAQMAKGGIVMDVVNADQAKIAEEAGVSIIYCMHILFIGKG